MLEETEFPTSLEGFGYKFNEKGELRNIDTNERFLFLVKPEDRSYNQKHYEKLGEVIGEFIENELVEKYNFIRKVIPVGSEEDDSVPKNRIYLSDNAQECQTLLLLIQGGGVVRPGQWARQVIINDSLENGTMFPYVRKAQELNWGIIILNPNESHGSIMKDGKIDYCQIPGSESPQKHCLYVWEHFVKNAKAEKVLIMAHSYGGISTTTMLECLDDFGSRVKGIAFTDSVHSCGMIPANYRKWFNTNTINWIKSPLPLNDYIHEAKKYYGCPCFSAGHSQHEYTSGTAIDVVFEFLQGRLKEKYDKEDQESETDKQSSAANNEDTTVVEEPNTSTTQETNLLPLEKDTTVTKESHSDSTMEVDEYDKKKNQESETDKQSSTANNEDTTVVKEPNASTTQETNLLPLEKDTTVTKESHSDSTMEVDEHDKKKNQESETDKKSSTTNNEVVKEPNASTTQEVTDSTMEVDELPKAEINMQTQEISPGSTVDESSVPLEKDDKATESQIDSSMEMVDESPNTVVPDAKEKSQPKEILTSDKILGQTEPFTNDNKESQSHK